MPKQEVSAWFEGAHWGERCGLCFGQAVRLHGAAFPAPPSVPSPGPPALGARPSGQTAFSLLAKNWLLGKFSLSAPPARALAWGAPSGALGVLTAVRSCRHRSVLVVQVSFPESSFVPRRWTPLDEMRALMLYLLILEAMFSVPSCNVKAFSLPQP